MNTVKSTLVGPMNDRRLKNEKSVTKTFCLNIELGKSVKTANRLDFLCAIL